MNLRRLQLLTIMFSLVICSSVTFGQKTFQLETFQDTSATDGVDAGWRDTLTFGFASTATLCVDALLGESELPPKPPSGVYDARFTDEYADVPCLGQGQKVDMLPEGLVEYGFTLQGGDGTVKSILVSWPALTLTDFPGGLRLMNDATVDIDMLAQTSVLITRTQYLNKFIFLRGTTSDVKQENELVPTGFSLKQNYPNPFNPSTTIKFSIAASVFADVAVYDVLGRRIATLASEELKPGFYSTTWNGTDNNGLAVSSGVYYVRMLATGEQNVGFSAVQKLLLKK